MLQKVGSANDEKNASKKIEAAALLEKVPVQNNEEEELFNFQCTPLQLIIDTHHKVNNDVAELHHKRKWKEIQRLHRTLMHPDLASIAMTGHDQAIYETFYRSVPKEFVSKPRFIGVMRYIYREVDKKGILSKQLETLSHCFERISGSNKTLFLNWRLFLCSLRMLRFPRDAMANHLKWNFTLYSSEGYWLHPTPHCTISREQLKHVFTFSAGNTFADRVLLERVQDAESLITMTAPKRVSYQRFCKILEQPPLLELFQSASDYTTYYVELCSPDIRNSIHDEGKDFMDRVKMKKFLDYYSNMHVHRVMNTWIDFCSGRQSARNVMKVALTRLSRDKLTYTLKTWKAQTIYHVSSLEIQRVARGYLGRKVVAKKYGDLNSIVMIQRLYKRRRFFANYVRQMRLYSVHAITVQRTYRGRVGRMIARRKLLAYYQHEMQNIRTIRATLALEKSNAAAKAIQETWSGFLAHRRELAAEAERLKEAEEEAALRAMLMEATRQEEIYMDEVSAYYGKLRAETRAKKERAAIDAKEKVKLTALRRSREWDAWRAAKAEAAAAVEAQEAAHLKDFQEKWGKTMEERASEAKIEAHHVLKFAMSKEEFELRTSLKKEMSVEAKRIKAGYKESGVVVAAYLIEERAYDAVIAAHVEREREVVRKEAAAAEVAYRKKQAKAADDKRRAEIQEENRIANVKATMIQYAYKRYSARKQLATLAGGIYTKEYDPESGEAIYVNSETKTVFKDKPKCLGDIEMVDKWFLTPDVASGKNYYYNPRHITMSWSFPDKCVVCSSCMEAFTTIYCPVPDETYCADCYDRAVERDDSISAHMKSFDGALEGAEDLLENVRRATKQAMERAAAEEEAAA